MKPCILIVENEAVLYDGIYNALENNFFEPSEYIKSADEAITSIKKRKPDLVLLDINLKGKANNIDGIELAHVLNKEYKIPFIFLTELSEERVFNLGLESNPEEYIVKAKPSLDIEHLIRTIRVKLNKVKLHQITQNNKIQNTKESILVFTDYLENFIDVNSSKIKQVPLNYSKIVLFSTKSIYDKNLKTTIFSKKNYCLVLTIDGEVFYLKQSLSEILYNTPRFFARISESEIINLLPNVFDGTTNNSSIIVNGLEFKVSETFKSSFKSKLDLIYNHPK